MSVQGCLLFIGTAVPFQSQPVLFNPTRGGSFPAHNLLLWMEPFRLITGLRSWSVQKRKGGTSQSNQTCRYKSVFSGRVQKYYYRSRGRAYLTEWHSILAAESSCGREEVLPWPTGVPLSSFRFVLFLRQIGRSRAESADLWPEYQLENFGSAILVSELPYLSRSADWSVVLVSSGCRFWHVNAATTYKANIRHVNLMFEAEIRRKKKVRFSVNFLHKHDSYHFDNVWMF